MKPEELHEGAYYRDAAGAVRRIRMFMRGGGVQFRCESPVESTWLETYTTTREAFAAWAHCEVERRWVDVDVKEED